MNGATAEPPPITIRTPIRIKRRIIGVNHHFFRSFMNLNRSLRKSIVKYCWFVNVKNQKLNDIVAVRFVDKGLTSAKEFKKYTTLTTFKCIKTGTTEACCNSNIKQRIYHITI